MEKEFIPYEQALELKELGFDEECLAWHNGVRLFIDNYNAINSKMYFDYCCSIPLYQQAFRWFRKKHDKHCYVEAYTLSSGGKRYDYTILSNEGEDEWDDGETWETYEQAELACLKKLIEIVKNK
jgi:hypothetical protein